MEYKVITSINSETFHKTVNNHMKLGWKPQGGICIYTRVNSEVCLLQAMVKTRKKLKKDGK
jgi:hypothetical protein